MQGIKKEKPPTAAFGYSIKRVQKAITAVSDELSAWEGMVLEGTTLNSIIGQLDGMKRITLPNDELYTLISPMAGLPFTREIRRKFVTKILYTQFSPLHGRRDRVSLERSGHSENEWAPVHIHFAKRTRTNALQLDIEIIGGLAVYEKMAVYIKPRAVWKFVQNMGFPKRGLYRWSQLPPDLINLWCAYMIEAGSKGSTRLTYFEPCGQCVNHNKPFIEARKVCPYGKPHPCWRCPKGFHTSHGVLDKDDSFCAYATRKYPWVKRRCVEGHEGWFKHNDKYGLCIHCEKKRKKYI